MNVAPGDSGRDNTRPAQIEVIRTTTPMISVDEGVHTLVLATHSLDRAYRKPLTSRLNACLTNILSFIAFVSILNRIEGIAYRQAFTLILLAYSSFM